jgi:hypothetical protein
MKKSSKNFAKKSQQVNYLSKDFDQFEQNLLEYAKTYFPNTFKDFNPTSPGMLYIKLASYVGDVLSYYTDYQFKEALLPYTTERGNIMANAKTLGYKPKVTRPAFCPLDVFQLVPSIEVDGVAKPDFRFAFTLLQDMEVTTSEGVGFITTEAVDFSVDSQDSPLTVTAYSRDELNQVQLFLLKKTVNAYSGRIVEKQVSVGSAQEFFRIELDEDNVIDVLSVIDSDNNKWHEVDYLSQDIVYTDVENVKRNDGEFYRFKESVPSLIGSLRTNRKFITGVSSDDKTYLEFGAGINSSEEDEIILDIKNIQKSAISKLNATVDPSKFLQSQNYGLAPNNTILTVRYIVGGGIEANINSNEVTQISNVEYSNALDDYPEFERELVLNLRNSLKVTNSEAATGGAGAETDEEIRENALAYHQAQSRIVSKEDYVARILSMPSRYGSVAKVHVATDNEISEQAVNADKNLDKSFDINIYTLTLNKKKQLVKMNAALRNNVKQYISRYRMLTDEVNLMDGFIVNIGVYFEITTFKGENKREVLVRCLNESKEFFNIDNMNFNQTINISKFELALANVEGVQSVQNVKVRNLTKVDGDDYSDVEYNIEKATIDKIIYPSLDPSIFEVKNPGKDISGKCL